MNSSKKRRKQVNGTCKLKLDGLKWAKTYTPTTTTTTKSTQRAVRVLAYKHGTFQTISYERADERMDGWILL
jgi:hypothetical protein